MKAIYRCLECNYRYKSKPMPTQCPVCKNLYVKWENYEEWYEQSEVKKFNDKNNSS